MAHAASVHRWDELALEKVTEMIARKAIVGLRDTITQTFLKRGALVPRHAHGTEQMIYVLQGTLRTCVGDDASTLHEGEVMQVPAGLAHQIEALDDTFVLDIKGTEAPCH